MASQRSTKVQSVYHRPGEGHVVDMVVSSSNDDGIVGHFDLGSLPVPDRKFSCDAASLQIRSDQVQLLFAQSQPIGAGLLSMLVINMTKEAVVQFFDSVGAGFMADYQRSVKDPTIGEVAHFTENAQQSVVLSGSLIMAGFSGSDGCMDFYYASPFSMHRVSIVKKMSVEAVVRVNLPTRLLFGILKKMGEVSGQTPVHA